MPRSKSTRAPVRSFEQLSPAVAERFWSKVDKTLGHGPAGTCWIWAAGTFPNGYGQFFIGRIDGQSITAKAHRIAYALTYGTVPSNQLILHRCDTKACVNPSHLLLGSPKENTVDAAIKGLMPRGSRHGMAKLSDKQVVEARMRRASGEIYRTIAEDFGVTLATIRNVTCGNNWKHLK